MQYLTFNNLTNSTLSYWQGTYLNCDSMIYSKNNKVEITDKGDVRFFAKDVINLNYGFEADTNSRFETMIDSFLLCTTPDSILQQGMSPPILGSQNDVEDKSLQVSIFPNPFSTDLSLQIKNNLEMVIAKVVIYNLQGQILLQSNILIKNDAPIEIPESGFLEKGIYLIKVLLPNNIVKFNKVLKL